MNGILSGKGVSFMPTRSQYSSEFKEQAVKRVLKGEPATAVARELEINVNSLYTWKTRYIKHPEQPFVGSGNLRDEDAEYRRLLKENQELREENEFLKKASAFFARNQK